MIGILKLILMMLVKETNCMDVKKYLSTKSEFYKAGWKASEGNKDPKREPDGDNPFFVEYENGWSDQLRFKENSLQMMADVA
jgi:hypothetical protein